MNEQNSEHGCAQVTHLHQSGLPRGRIAEAPSVSLRAPRSLADTGLPPVFVGRLVLKSTLLNGKSSFSDLSERHRLPVSVLEDVLAFLVRERLAEITHRGATDIDVHFRLTEAGRDLAVDEISRCSYCGPAPVAYENYVEIVREHSVRRQRISQSDVRAAFRDLRIDPALLDAAAASLNAGRPLLLYGPAGSGKTFLAERLGLLLQGDVPIPYAIYVSGEIVQLYDPLLHHDAPAASSAAAGDKRWRMCRRPVVISGGELTLEGLDLRYDAAAGFYQAPPHMKANMGLYIVDDLGRQRVAAQDLLNRWIMPLDRAVDLFTLQSGSRFSAPFDVWPVFSSNLDPAAIGDEAFLRRLGSKLHIGPLPLDSYRAVFEARCASLGLAVTPSAFDYLLHNLHMVNGKPFLACYPGDLLSLVNASVDYRGAAREVTEEGLREAWDSYFGAVTDHNSRYPPAIERPGKKLAAGE
ncbi:ATP-binding protein [Trinickia violacea]|uniref:ATP-binding protein n=1 Tax=Trinickia violacea TaxID=2571746 RepID=A0A4P8J264_9BURK|nr:ATP-binding protein [Trinickia violacea]QCP53834.1 ATP-binding protein [Trinickia violacea]